MHVPSEPEELEVVILVDDLLHQLALRVGEHLCEVRQRLALPLVAPGRDVVFEHLARPGVLDSMLGVP